MVKTGIANRVAVLDLQGLKNLFSEIKKQFERSHVLFDHEIESYVSGLAQQLTNNDTFVEVYKCTYFLGSTLEAV